MCVFVCACVFACVRALACVHACNGCACVYEGVYVRLFACTPVCESVYVCMCVRACLRACVCASVDACMRVQSMYRHVCVSGYVSSSVLLYFTMASLSTECVYGEYGTWSRCSASCGEGVTARWRSVLVKPDWPTNACRDREQKKQCHEAPCVGGECVIVIFDRKVK